MLCAAVSSIVYLCVGPVGSLKCGLVLPVLIAELLASRVSVRLPCLVQILALLSELWSFAFLVNNLPVRCVFQRLCAFFCESLL